MSTVAWVGGGGSCLSIRRPLAQVVLMTFFTGCRPWREGVRVVARKGLEADEVCSDGDRETDP